MSRMNGKKTHTHTTHCMFWCPYMVSVQYDGGLLPDIILLTLCDSIGESFEYHVEFLSLHPLLEGLDMFRFFFKQERCKDEKLQSKYACADQPSAPGCRTDGAINRCMGSVSATSGPDTELQEVPDEILQKFGMKTSFSKDVPKLPLFLSFCRFCFCCVFVLLSLELCRCLKKNQNAPRPSEHPPVMGGKMSKCLGGIKGCK